MPDPSTSFVTLFTVVRGARPLDLSVLDRAARPLLSSWTGRPERRTVQVQMFMPMTTTSRARGVISRVFYREGRRYEEQIVVEGDSTVIPSGPYAGEQVDRGDRVLTGVKWHLRLLRALDDRAISPLAGAVSSAVDNALVRAGWTPIGAISVRRASQPIFDDRGFPPTPELPRTSDLWIAVGAGALLLGSGAVLENAR